ncbi:pyridoxal phosphate-dependent transferase [Thermothelomyces heterothallicus CBS 202.75]|uniref:pyridoxal phosphate-dependent transferase n=1 Tax=Thermothelomyces heterothallicus CBS 202.75 TaxID=1149848 RepID=UPI0037423E69
MAAEGTISEPENLTLGSSLPPGNPHGVSVHLPKWADTVGWARRESRVLEAMKTGYPRFFVPRVVDRLATRLLEQQKSELGDRTGDQKLAILLNSIQHAHLCRKVLPRLSPQPERGEPPDIGVFLVTWEGQITPVPRECVTDRPQRTQAVGEEDIFLVAFPADIYLAAKAFWQHTGFGISSRRAAYWLETAPFLVPTTAPKALISPTERARQLGEGLGALRTRIAAGQSSPPDNLHVDLSDVFLFPTGMTAIAETATTIKSFRPTDSSSPPRVAVFGFLYVDTNKVLSRILGFEAVQYHSTSASLSALEADLEGSPTTTNQTATPKRLDLLVTEFPGNPLLQAPDLERLGRLARTHGFALVVDDTVGTHVNLALLAHCDVICTSLTKMFSGACDVMGGSAVLNPASPYRDRLARALGRGRAEPEERAWFWEDVVHMERNSRDFGERVRRASENARRVAGMLRPSGSVSEVYYPLGSPTQSWYDRYRREGAGYGYLLSVKFKTPARAVAFYDALDVAKGPSLGTNFTLCCAYTLLAHYKELEWAADQKNVF